MVLRKAGEDVLVPMRTSSDPVSEKIVNVDETLGKSSHPTSNAPDEELSDWDASDRDDDDDDDDWYQHDPQIDNSKPGQDSSISSTVITTSTQTSSPRATKNALSPPGITTDLQRLELSHDGTNSSTPIKQTNPFLRNRSIEQPPLISVDTEEANPWVDPIARNTQAYPQPLASSNEPDRIQDLPFSHSPLPFTEAQSPNPKAAASLHARDQLSSSSVQGNSATAKRQRNETYQIKHIRWYDADYTSNPRKSSLLIQNANGPCPLLALVNALVLSTPPELHTALTDTLQGREQVSLGLLLDAVFDELTSGRRGDATHQLPDIAELYSFLVTLHTGMNVNPRFIASTQAMQCGGFEQTQGTKLYSTFSVPLLHGWLPRREEEAHAAFERSASTYEDAQNIQFREEDLEAKLKTGQLNNEEQALFMDLTSIKQFFATWPTQLSDYGLLSIQQSLRPGQIAILFRNDHFSTIYKEPRSKRLMTLITDAGYAAHQEIVWESLVDITGSKSEIFSGDFKSVSHSTSTSGQSSEGWVLSQTQAPSDKLSSTTENPTQQPNASHSRTLSEQDDHDLALAMQLQEEEEDRHRKEVAARRREVEQSERYLSGETARRGPQIPPRRNNVPNPSTAAAEEDIPPSYERSASDRLYQPPTGPPPGRNSSRSNMQSAGVSQAVGSQMGGRRRTSRQNASTNYPTSPFDTRRTGTESYDSVQDRREGCNIM